MPYKDPEKRKAMERRRRKYKTEWQRRKRQGRDMIDYRLSQVLAQQLVGVIRTDVGQTN